MFDNSQADRALNVINTYKCRLCITQKVLNLLSLVIVLTHLDVHVAVWPVSMGACHEMCSYINIIFKCTFCLFLSMTVAYCIFTDSKFMLGILGKITFFVPK